jgi:hypothetical protein
VETGVFSSSRNGVPRQCHGPTAILRQTTKTVGQKRLGGAQTRATKYIIQRSFDLEQDFVAEWLPWLLLEHTRRQTWMFPWETTLSDVHRTRRFEPCRSRLTLISFMVAFCIVAIYIIGMSDLSSSTVHQIHARRCTMCVRCEGKENWWSQSFTTPFDFPSTAHGGFAKQMWKYFENSATYAYSRPLSSQFRSQRVGVRPNTGENKCWIPSTVFWYSQTTDCIQCNLQNWNVAINSTVEQVDYKSNTQPNPKLSTCVECWQLWIWLCDTSLRSSMA